jgi:malate dehydrogenase
VEIGRTGWTRIVDYKLTAEEQELFRKSGDAVRNMNDVLATLSL